eukprot:7236445-Alexandrium_andersonii.AAC.1
MRGQCHLPSRQRPPAVLSNPDRTRTAVCPCAHHVHHVRCALPQSSSLMPLTPAHAPASVLADCH